MLPINTRKASWSTITFVETYAYMEPYGLLFMALISLCSYSVGIATWLPVLPLYHWIPFYNELTNTSRPNVLL